MLCDATGAAEALLALAEWHAGGEAGAMTFTSLGAKDRCVFTHTGARARARSAHTHCLAACLVTGQKCGLRR